MNKNQAVNASGDCTTELSGWKPAWDLSWRQLKRSAADLASLVGESVTRSWLAWAQNDDSRFADGPVVLQFAGGRQLEICWSKRDDLSISWNTIDIAEPGKSWVGPISWRPDARPALEAMRGHRVTSVSATEYRYGMRRGQASAWLIDGLWLQTTGPGLHVFNADDENGLGDTYDLGTGARRLVSITLPPE